MATNYLLANPIKVVIYDPINDRALNTKIFLGDVPKAVFNACHYYQSVSASQRQAYDKVLEQWYGPEYKKKLGLDIKDKSRAFLGGATDLNPKSYREKGSFTHLGHQYDLECALELATNTSITQMKIRDLSWILDRMPADYFEDPFEQMRLAAADTSAPILVTPIFARDTKTANPTIQYVTIDGIHRLKKALDARHTYLPVKIISPCDLKKCHLNCPQAAKILGLSTRQKSRFGAADDYDDSDIEQLLLSSASSKNIKPGAEVKSPVSPKKHKEPVQKHPSEFKISTFANENLRSDIKVGAEPTIDYITVPQIFPEDKFSDIREKIYLATNIPMYRQHVFYHKNSRVWGLYRLYADGLHNTDITKLLSAGVSATSHINIHGIPIDKPLYDMREQIRVEALDMFVLIGGSTGIGSATDDNTIYVVDLDLFIDKIRSRLPEIAGDSYQFDLFYYGFINKFWPQMTHEVALDFVLDESELQHKYPELAKNKLALGAIYRAEQSIIASCYKNAIKAEAYAAAHITMAITQMVATVSATRTMLNIRNIFDKLKVTRCIPEIHAYVEYNHKRYLLRKRHARNGINIPFPTNILMRTGVIIAISLRKSDQESFHAARASTTAENEQSRYLFLNIWPNGRYFIKTVWNEEDEYNFEDIIKVMKKFTDPLITSINSLGRYAFIAGTTLPLITKFNIGYQSLNICVFWKKVLLESVFKVVRGLWEPYLRARITGARNVQQFDKYEFMFRKGMYEFDLGAVEKIVTASNNIMLTNQYAFLSNSAVKQKWDQTYDGRIVRMSHRTTDLRFEVSDIREHEFRIFHRYILDFIYTTAHSAQLKQAIHARPTNVKRLRKLREQDPELFNLKKYGSKKVYSRVCQNQFQPLIYTTDEIKEMGPAEVKKLTQYWNFTLNKPAFYGCPSKKYPHLSFIVGVHPKHYCLPCCNKKPQSGEDSKKARVITSCMRDHTYDIQATGLTSRHIMGYGKDIDIGRLSKPPQTLVNLLFVGEGNSTADYYLYGVAQSLPGVDCGVLYSAAVATNSSIEQLIQQILDTLGVQHFSTLLNGTLIEYFRDIEDLKATIKDLFLSKKMFIAFKFRAWTDLLIEMLYLIDIAIYLFIETDGLIDLQVISELKTEIIGRGDQSSTTTPTTNIIVLQKQNNLQKLPKYYPLFMINVDKYFRNGDIIARTYARNSSAYQIIADVIGAADTTSDRLTLALVKDFCKRVGYKLLTKYVNRRNLCYCVLLEDENGHQIYLPISYSIHTSDGVEVSFEPGADFSKTSLPAIIQLVKNLAGDSVIMTPNRLIVSAGTNGPSTAIEYLYGGVPYIFRFLTPGEADLDIPTVNIRYDPVDVNRAILERRPVVSDPRITRIGSALYNNYQYQLFLIEFVNYLDHERNVEVRKQIKEMIKNTQFKKDITDFRRRLKGMIPSADYQLLNTQLTAFYQTLDKAELMEQIDATVYDFDRQTLNRLKTLPREEIKAELRKIATSFTAVKEIGAADTVIKFPNVYMPCSDMTGEPTGYCDGKKLLIRDQKNLDELIDILAADLQNELKAMYLFNNIWMDTFQNYLSFEQRANEIVTIYKLSE